MGTNKISTQFMDMHEQMMEKKGELVTLTKTTETLDVDGHVTSTSTTSDTGVKLVIQPLREQDRELIGRGTSLEGFMKAYCDPSYDLTNNGDNTEIEIGDLITRSSAHESQAYRVEEIVSRTPSYGNEIYRKLLLRRVSA